MSSTTVSESTSQTRGPEATVSGPRAARRLSATFRAFDPLGVIGLVAIFVAWYVVTKLQLVNSLYLPALPDVWFFWKANFFSSPLIAAQSLGDNGIWGNLEYSVAGVWLGVLIAVAVGLPVGLLSARAIKVRMFSDPLLLAISGIPILVIAPFFMIWFGPARTTQLLLLT